MIRALFSIVALTALVGCMEQRDYVSPPQDDVFTNDPYAGYNGDGQASNIAVANGRVFGDIGAVRDFDQPADQVDAWYDGSYNSTNITLTANDPQDRMGMFILDVEGVDLRAMHPGTYNYNAESVDSFEGGYVTVTGCSSSPDTYYDEPGQSGTVTIQDTPQGRQVDVDAQLPQVDSQGNPTTGNSTAHGSFTIQQ